MVVIIKKDSEYLNVRIIVIFTILVVIAVIVILLWIYVINPYIQSLSGDGTTPGVECISPPGIPIGLQTSVSGNSVEVSWQPNQLTDSYKLYVSSIDGFSPGTAERTISITDTTYNVINLLPIPYFFRLSAVNSCGESNVTAQVSATVTTWADKVKVCKADAPNLCLLLPHVLTQNARVSLACPNDECDLSYPNQTNITCSCPGSTFCLQESPGLGIPVEEVVQVQNCDMGSDQEWDIDLAAGRIVSNGGFCLGADNVPESFAFDTDCSLITPTDSRYLWTIQPIQ